MNDRTDLDLRVEPPALAIRQQAEGRECRDPRENLDDRGRVTVARQGHGNALDSRFVERRRKAFVQPHWPQSRHRGWEVRSPRRAEKAAVEK